MVQDAAAQREAAHSQVLLFRVDLQWWWKFVQVLPLHDKLV